MPLFDTVVLQAISRRFHRYVDDTLLDRCACECGNAPIGRLCLLDDDAIAEILEHCEISDGKSVLDLGCGRGFLGRWLEVRGTHVRYVGIDRIPEAIHATREHVPGGTTLHGDFRAMDWRPTFDSVVALEISIDGTVEEATLEISASALKVDGRLALSLASLDGGYADRLDALSACAREHFSTIELVDWTERVQRFAQRTYEWWLTAPWHPEIAEKCLLEAKVTLGGIERGDFHYAVLFARK